MDNFNQNQNNYSQGNYNNGMNMNTNFVPQQGSAPDYTLWLILGIVQICLICCCNIFTCVCGIITVVSICQANNYFKTGNLPMYQGKLKTAKTANIIGWALIVLSLIINIVTGMFSSVMDIIN